MTEVTILKGVVGSHAYGLNRPDSDTDRIGFYVAPTDEWLGLHHPPETHVTTHPDVTMHEIGKAAALMLRCNPTLTETLWLDEYEVCNKFGRDLVALRDAFLSASAVRNAYFGYATQQFVKLNQRGDSFSSDTRKRTKKHARHLKRLLTQGLELYATGSLTVRLEDPDAYFAFGDAVSEDPTVANDLLAKYEAAFAETTPAISDAPNERAVERWLVELRIAFLPG